MHPPFGIAKIVGILAAALGLLSGAGSVSAAQLEYVPPAIFHDFYGDGGCLQDGADLYCGETIDILYQVQIPDFDDSLGTLESVTLRAVFEFNAQATYSIHQSVQEMAPWAGSVAATNCLGLEVGGTCSVDYGDYVQIAVESFAVRHFDGAAPFWFEDYFGGVDHVYGYQAWGDIELRFLSEPDVTITYVYTPIPEPSTGALVAVGLAGMRAARRRKPRAGSKARLDLQQRSQVVNGRAGEI